MQRSSAHSEKMRQLKEIEDQLGKHARETARVGDEWTGSASAESTYRTERDAWEALLKDRDDLLDKQCAKLDREALGAGSALMYGVTRMRGLRQS